MTNGPAGISLIQKKLQVSDVHVGVDLLEVLNEWILLRKSAFAQLARELFLFCKTKRSSWVMRCQS